MKTIVVLIAAALGVTLLGGCASYPGGYGYYYEPYGYYYDYDGGNGGRGHGSKYGGGRSEPGNEAGMTPGRPGDGRGSTRAAGPRAAAKPAAPAGVARAAAKREPITLPMKKASRSRVRRATCASAFFDEFDPGGRPRGGPSAPRR